MQPVVQEMPLEEHELVAWQGEAHQGPAALQATLASTCHRTPCSVEQHMIPQDHVLCQKEQAQRCRACAGQAPHTSVLTSMLAALMNVAACKAAYELVTTIPQVGQGRAA